MYTGMSMSSQISVDIGVVQGTETDGTIELRLTLFSTVLKYGSVALFYKRDALDDWRSDAVITFSNARFKSGNEMRGLPCSSSGAESRLIWNHNANGIASGSRCMVKAMVVPTLAVTCATDEFSRVETLFNGDDRIIDKGIFGNMVGNDQFGNLF